MTISHLTKPKHARFIWIFCTLFFGLLLLFTIGYQSASAMIRSSNSEEIDYLENLRESSEFGCKTMLARQPELLLIGNSGSYASWDPRLLQRLTGLRVGACMMGNFSLETVIPLLDLVKKLDHPPQYIVLGTNIYTFLDREYRFRADHQSLIGEAKRPYEFVLKLMLNKLVHHRPYPISAHEVDMALNTQGPKLATNAIAIENHLHLYPPKDLADITKELQRSPPLKDSGKHSVDTICQTIGSLGSQLFVITTPSSPLAENLYSSDLWTYYEGAMSQFSECAKKVVTMKSRDFGLENFHYANREMKDMDYKAWHGGDSAPVPFDPDHSNRLGAIVFTTKASRLLFDQELLGNSTANKTAAKTATANNGS